MGARGRNATSRRGVHKNSLRPNAYRNDVTEYSHPYWDLMLGDQGSHGRFWADPYDPEREQAWLAWRERLRVRWPYGWGFGDRPDAWVCFELPRIMLEAIDAKRFTKKEIDGWPTLEETVYWLDADEKEREQIETEWRKDIRLFGVDGDHDVPAWFLHRECPPA